ncbi:MAG: hypothetical protein RR212_02255 [Bacteroidales bacterium]
MKGQKLDEAKAGVDQENFGGIPYQEEEYYEYRNWLETYLINNPNDSGLSEDELLKKYRQLNPNATISPSGPKAIQGDKYDDSAPLDTEVM